MTLRSEDPTNAELAILAVIWERGPSTVRDVYEALLETRGTGYTTMLKLMQIMVGKGLLERDESTRTHVYRAARAQAETQRTLVGRLVERAFAGSAARLVEHALDPERTTTEEIDEIRRRLDEIDPRRAGS